MSTTTAGTAATTVTPRATAAPGRPHRSPLVRVLRLVRYPLLAACGLWLAAGVNATRVEDGLVRAVGHDTVASIEAARRIGTGVAKAHGGFLSSVVATRTGAVPDGTRGLDDVVTALVTATRNVTYPGEEAAILAFAKGLGHYDDATARAESPDPAEAAKGLRAADRVESDVLLKSADDLEAVNRRELDARWDGRHDGLAWWGLALASLVLLGTMAYAQVEMTLRTRRILNPYLAPATVLVVVASVVMLQSLSTASADLRTAKVDAFSSIDALWRTRALAAQAHDEVVQAVLDAGDAARQDVDAKSFGAEAATILPDEARGRVVAASGADITKAGLAGLIGEEMRDVTFPGEADAARRMLRAWTDAVAVDRGVLADVRAAGLDDPKALATREAGTLRSAAEAHGRFDAAADAVVRINDEAFARSVSGADDATSDLWEWAVASALAAAALSYLGLRQRLDEYGR